MQGMLCAPETCLRDGKIGCFLPNWIFVHQLFPFFVASYISYFCMNTCPWSECHDKRVTTQSHRWHLAVGSERSRSPGKQKVTETVSLNLNCFLQASKLQRQHYKQSRLVWYGWEIAPKNSKKPCLCLLLICSQLERCTDKAVLIKCLGTGEQLYQIAQILFCQLASHNLCTLKSSCFSPRQSRCCQVWDVPLLLLLYSFPSALSFYSFSTSL